MTKKANQTDKEGYNEGLRTGMVRGYKRGIEDGLKVIKSILEHNDIHMAESEFYLELDTLIEEGEIVSPEGS